MKDKYVDEFRAALDEDGIATAPVTDGRILAISKKKLLELLKITEEKNSEYITIFIKSLASMN